MDMDMSWQDSMKFITNTAEVNNFYTKGDHQLISFNKQGTLCFNRGGQWHPDEGRVDFDIIIKKLADANLEPLIKRWTAFSIHRWYFLEYLDRLDMLDKITYLAYGDPYISLPIKYIKKMTALRILIIEPHTTCKYDKPTSKEHDAYQDCLAELVIQLPPTLEILFIHYPLFNGKLTNLPPKLRILCIISEQFNESLDYLPLNLEVFILLQLHDYTHNIMNLPPLLKLLALDLCQGSYTGGVTLPPKLEYLLLTMDSSDSFLAAIEEQDYQYSRDIKTILCNLKCFDILIDKRQHHGILQNTVIKSFWGFSCTDVINKLLHP
jgi:hypothetical protein